MGLSVEKLDLAARAIVLTTAEAWLQSTDPFVKDFGARLMEALECPHGKSQKQIRPIEPEMDEIQHGIIFQDEKLGFVLCQFCFVSQGLFTILLYSLYLCTCFCPHSTCL